MIWASRDELKAFDLVNQNHLMMSDKQSTADSAEEETVSSERL